MAINEFLAAIATVGASVLAIITYAIVSPTFNISNVFTAIAFLTYCDNHCNLYL